MAAHSLIRTGARSKDRVGTQVHEVLLHLHQIQSAVVVSAAALRRQNCELDDDVANVLQRSVADRIQDQIERVESLMRSAPNR